MSEDKPKDPEDEQVIHGLERYLESAIKYNTPPAAEVAIPTALLHAAVQQIHLLMDSMKVPVDEKPKIAIFHSKKTKEIGLMFNYHVKTFGMPATPDGRRLGQAIKDACDEAEGTRIIVPPYLHPKNH